MEWRRQKAPAMQGMGKEQSILQLLGLGESSVQELPVFCLLSTLFGESHTCSHECHSREVPASSAADLQSDQQATSQISCVPVAAASPRGTPSGNTDLKCIALLPSTPYRKASTPRDLMLDTDNGGDWSISMATPISLHLPVGSTPIITTTDDEESDHEMSVSSTEKQLVTLRPLGNPVARTLFTAGEGAQHPPSSSGKRHTQSLSTPLASPSVRGSTAVHGLHGKLYHFSPICASPLLSYQQRQSPSETNVVSHDASVSLISSHTVLETPTGRGSRRIEPESAGHDKVLCDKSGQHQVVACSQELFGSPEVLEVEGDKGVAREVDSVPDSPSSQPASFPLDRDDLTLVVEDDNLRGKDREERDCSHVEAVVADAESEDGDVGDECSEAAMSLIVNTDKSCTVPSVTLSDKSAMGETHPPVQTEPLAKRRRVTANMFLYPGSRELTSRRHQPHREVSEVKQEECPVSKSPALPLVSSMRIRRKRTASSSGAPPKKKAHPVLQASKVKPVLQASKVEPVLQASKVKPVLQASKVEPGPQASKVKPVLQASKVEVVLQASDVESVFQASDVESVFQASEVEPGPQASKVKPGSVQPHPELLDNNPPHAAPNTETLTGGSSSALTDLVSSKATEESDLSCQIGGVGPRNTSAVRRGSRALGLHNVPRREGILAKPRPCQETAAVASPDCAPRQSYDPTSPALPRRDSPAVGFTTASGHSIHISSRGMKIAKQVIAETAEQDTDSQERDGSEMKTSTVAGSASLVVPPLTGFQTASGRSLSFSEKGLQKARQLLSEAVDSEEASSAKSSTSPHTGTSSDKVPPDTGKVLGKPLPTPQSLSAVRKVKSVSFRTPSSSLSPHVTHSTGRLRARGVRQAKPFKAPRLAGSVSKDEEAAKIARLLQSMKRAGAGSDSAATETVGRGTDSVTTRPCLESGFSTGGGRKLSVSASSFQRAQQLMAAENEIASKSTSRQQNAATMAPAAIPPLSCGFQAASGRGLQVSANALERARSLLAGVEGDDTSTTSLHKVGPDATSEEDPTGAEDAVLASQSCFAGEEQLGQDDIDNFAAFTQLQFNQHRDPADSTDTEREANEGSGGSVHGEQGDDSVFFSTQVVRQFLDFSAEEEEENGEHKATPPQHSRPATSPRNPSHPSSQNSCQMDIVANSKISDSPDSPGLCWDDSALTDTPTGQASLEDKQKSPSRSTGTGRIEAEEVCSSFCLQATSTSVIDELFGIESGPSEPASQEQSSTVQPTQQKPSETQAEPLAVLTEVVREGSGSAVEPCGDECEMSASMVESLAAVDDSIVLHAEQNSTERGGGDPPAADMEQFTQIDRVDVEAVDDGRERVEGTENVRSRNSSILIDSAEGGPRSFPGLMTASGKKIAVSHSALSAARAALNVSSEAQSPTSQPSLSLPPSIPSTSFPGLQTTSGKQVEISEAALQAVRKSDSSMLSSNTVPSVSELSRSGTGTACFPGLQTASGKQVEISEAALQAVRKSDSSTLSSNTVPSVSELSRSGTGTACFPGLQTASGKQVEISEAALQAVRQSDSSTLSSNTVPSVSKLSGSGTACFPGLQTASGKQVEISEAALQAVRQSDSSMLSSNTVPSVSELSGSGTACFPGLQTASGKQVEISEAALQAVRQSDSSTLSINTVPSVSELSGSGTACFPGLQTASGKNVEVSQEALKKAQQMLGSGEADVSGSVFTGLQTAGGSRVEVSQSALAAARLSFSGSLSSSSVPTASTTAPSGASTVGSGPPSGPPSSSGRAAEVPRRVVPHLKQPTHSASSTTKSSVRYRPVFRRGQNTPSLPPRGSASSPFLSRQPNHPPAPTDRHTAARGLHSTPEGVLYDRAPGMCRRTLTPMQSYLGPDGTYMSTPVQRYRLRSMQSAGVTEREVRRVSPAPASQLNSTEDATEPGSGAGGEEKETEEIKSNREDFREELTDASQEQEQEAGVKGAGERQKQSSSTPTTASQTSASSTPQRAPRQGESRQNEEVEEATETAAEKTLGVGAVPELGGSKSGSEEYGVCAMDELNDSLEEDCGEEQLAGEVGGEPTAHNSSLPAVKVDSRATVSRKSSKTAVKKRQTVIPRNAGALLTTRLQLSEERVPLVQAIGCRVPGRYRERELCRAGVHPSTIRVTAQNAAEFEFSGELFFSAAVLRGSPVCVGDGAMLRLKAGRAGAPELWEAFAASPGVDRKLVSFEWFQTHYRWVVWKLAALEVAFPAKYAGRHLTPDWLLQQVRYRYDREIEGAERPALRKICERDDLSSRRLALCVCAVLPGQPRPSPAAAQEGEPSNCSPNPPSIAVTDGWYSLPAILDPPLKYMLQTGRITVGTKILTCGAELVGSSDACHPLDVPSSLCLQLSANSTRRARWFTKLGYQPSPHPFPVSLASLFRDGGAVGCTKVVIARVYPLIYMERVEEGRNVFRNARAEERASRLSQERRQRKIEAISMRVQREFEEEIAKQEQQPGSWRRSRRLNSQQVKQLQDGEAIHAALTNSPDPQAFQEVLSGMQCAMLESYRQSLVGRRQTELQRRLEQAVRRGEEEGKLPRARTTTALLRARLVPVGPDHTPLDCQLSVWQPREDVRTVLVEGRVVRLWNVNTSSNQKSKKGQSSRLQLSASRSTRFQSVTMDAAAMETALAGYRPRTRAEVPAQDGSARQVDTVYLADSEGALMAARVWDGLEHHGLKGLLSPPALVSAASLTYKGRHPTTGVVLTNAGDRTHFSQAPSEPHLREGLRELKASLPSNMQQYLHALEEEVMNIHIL